MVEKHRPNEKELSHAGGNEGGKLSEVGIRRQPAIYFCLHYRQFAGKP
jgi:hypothetical protein